MNYVKHYAMLIEKARGRPTPAGYLESHHVVPRSMGGDDSAGNLVSLTAREHFVAHWLLFLIHRNRSMAVAWGRMSRRGRVDHGFYSRNFAAARRALHYQMSGSRHPSAVAVMNVDTGEIFGTTREAAASINLSAAAVRSAIRANCRAGGYRWKVVGQGVAHEPAPRGQDKKRPIRNLTTGELYASATDAAAALRVKPRPIANAARSGLPYLGNHWNFEDAKVALRSKSRKVQNTDTGEIFPDYIAAADSVNRHPVTLMNAINRKAQCANCRWEYVPD